MSRDPRRPRLYVLADASRFGPDRLPSAVAEMAEAGVRWIQLRLKAGWSDALLFRVASECRRRLEGSETALWIDDRADLARLLSASGLHLGQADLPPAAARRILAPNCEIGLSTHDLEQVRAAEVDGAVDVVAFGPIFSTASKPNPDPVVGLEGLRSARAATSKPLVAIGGIDASRSAEVLAAGADAVAVIAAVSPEQVSGSCRALLAAVGGA